MLRSSHQASPRAQQTERHQAYRPDIDGLRCVAVLSVVLYHFGINVLPGGFVGVDVFFVISGFLITRIIASEIENKNFSYLAFYERRARRLLPMLTVVIAASYLAGWVLLLPDEFWRFARSAIGAQLFVSNGIFYLEDDYFNGPAEMKPLLHTWSLGIEEQFYLIAPTLIIAIYKYSRRRALAICFALCVASFVFAELMLTTHRSAAFYLLPSRMWELLLGSCVALGTRPSEARAGPGTGLARERETSGASNAARSRRSDAVLAAAGLAAILLSAVLMHKDMPFPGHSALLACCGTALVIMTGISAGTSVHRSLSRPAFVVLGRASYSIYLWHWPVFVFVNYYVFGQIDAAEILFMLAVTLALSFASYRLIEQPFRKPSTIARRSLVAGLSLSSAFLFGLGLSVWRTEGIPSRFPSVAGVGNVATDAGDGLRGICMFDANQEAPALWSEERCRISDGAGAPVLLWGDSHAGHLRHGFRAFAASIGRPVYLLSGGGCPPILGIDIPSVQSCKRNNAFSQELIDRLGIKTVILAANWSHAADDNKVPIDTLRRTIETLDRSGVENWVVGQLPIYSLKNPQYLYHRLKVGNYTKPSFSIPPHSGDRINRQLEDFVPEGRFLDIYKTFCTSGRCAIVRDNALMVIDSSHLSAAGSAVAVGSIVAKGVFRRQEALPSGPRPGKS